MCAARVYVMSERCCCRGFGCNSTGLQRAPLRRRARDVLLCEPYETASEPRASLNCRVPIPFCSFRPLNLYWNAGRSVVEGAPWVCRFPFLAPFCCTAFALQVDTDPTARTLKRYNIPKALNFKLDPKDMTATTKSLNLRHADNE